MQVRTYIGDNVFAKNQGNGCKWLVGGKFGGSFFNRHARKLSCVSEQGVL